MGRLFKVINLSHIWISVLVIGFQEKTRTVYEF